MSVDVRALVNRTKEIFNASRHKLMGVSLAFVLVSMLFGVLRSNVIGVNISTADYENYMALWQSGQLEYALQLAQRMLPPTSAYLIDLLLSLVMSVLGVGFTLYFLNTIRKTGPVLGNLLDGFGFALKIVMLTVVQGLVIALWSLLLVVPGIIAMYKYRMAKYILIDDPELSPIECLRRSKEMMDGHKKELFGLDLCFIIMLIVNSMPVIGYACRVLTLPIMEIAWALFYMTLRCEPIPEVEEITDGTNED